MANENLPQCIECIGLCICRSSVNPNGFSCNNFRKLLEMCVTHMRVSPCEQNVAEAEFSAEKINSQSAAALDVLRKDT